MSTASLSLAEPVRIGPEGLPKHTIGWHALSWSAEYLRQPDGPDAGAPWRFTREQARFVLWWYATDEAGRRFAYRRAMFRRIKGHGKDPLGAALCAIELAGPCRPDGLDASGEPVGIPQPSPWVITAAVSLDQTKNTMRLFPSLLSDAAIDEYGIDLGKEIIYARRGLLEAVTSSPRALEGTTFSLKNETHHWLESNDGLAMAEVIARNLTKARGGDARSLAISNAHNPGESSDAEADYDAYLSARTGRGLQDFLYDSIEAPPGIDITDPAQVRQGLIAARGDSDWLDLDRHVAEILDPRTREGMARRFYFNQIVAGDDEWLSRKAWDELAETPIREITAGAPLVVGFDGSDTDDWTAIRAETQDGYQFTPKFSDGKPMIWDPAQHSGYIPRGEVNAAIKYLFATFNVIRLYADPPYFQSEIDEWSSIHGDDHVVRWATYRPRQMAEALERFRTDALSGQISHDGCQITSVHVGNAHADRRPQGVLIRKDRAVSPRKIDAVLSSALAHEAAFDVTAAGLWGGVRRLTRVTGRVRGY
jgi:hypothetical protein